jgi:hypothetical protein
VKAKFHAPRRALTSRYASIELYDPQFAQRNYLVTLTSAETGLARADAERRVDSVIAQARDDIRKARRAAVILAFMAGAAALLGAAVAWFASCAGGRHRDGTAPSMSWGRLGPRTAN